MDFTTSSYSLPDNALIVGKNISACANKQEKLPLENDLKTSDFRKCMRLNARLYGMTLCKRNYPYLANN